MDDKNIREQEVGEFIEISGLKIEVDNWEDCKKTKQVKMSPAISDLWRR